MVYKNRSGKSLKRLFFLSFCLFQGFQTTFLRSSGQVSSKTWSFVPPRLATRRRHLGLKRSRPRLLPRSLGFSSWFRRKTTKPIGERQNPSPSCFMVFTGTAPCFPLGDLNYTKNVQPFFYSLFFGLGSFAVLCSRLRPFGSKEGQLRKRVPTKQLVSRKKSE